MSDLTMYLAQVFGLFFIIMGVVMMAKQKFMIPAMGMFVKEKSERFIFSTFEVLAGLFFVLGYQDWSGPVESILSVMAWLFVLEGLSYVALPEKVFASMVEAFNQKFWYIGGGIVSIALGVYMAGTGFGWF